LFETSYSFSQKSNKSCRVSRVGTGVKREENKTERKHPLKAFSLFESSRVPLYQNASAEQAKKCDGVGFALLR
jgi:hypothetical protein